MPRFKVPNGNVILLWLLIGVLASLFAGARRWMVESENRTVAIVLDCGELQRLGALSGKPFGDLLREFKRSGVVGVAVTEMKLSDLVSSGEVAILPRSLWGVVMGHAGDLKERLQGVGAMLSSGDYALLRALHSALRAKTGRDTYILMLSRNGAVLLGDAMLPYIGAEGLGINPRVAAAIRAAGLNVIARLSNTPQLTNAWLSYVLQQAKSSGVSLLVFDGEEVLGYRERIKDVARAMRKGGLTMATIEFAKQRGEQSLARELDGAIVRLHSITRQEMALQTHREIIQRFARAVFERGIRVCYIRMPTAAAGDSLESARKLIDGLSTTLTARGFKLGMPKPLEQPMPNRAIRILTVAIASVAVIAGFVLLLGIVLPMGASQRLELLFALTAIAVACSMALPRIWVLLCALLAALTFPLLAMCNAVRERNSTAETGARNVRECVALATAKFVACSAVTLLGAALIVCLLCDRRFMVVVEQFRGVKLSQLLPMLLLALVLLSGWLSDGDSDLHGRIEASLCRLKEMLTSPVLWWHAAISIIVLAVGAYWLIRTGNIVPEAAPTWELKFRELLERMLIVRPRFKEAFIGHPMLMLAFGLRALKMERASTPLLLIGFIGQLSMLNTFTHIHTPLYVSLLRTAHGLWIGWLIGAVALAVVCFVILRERQR